MHLVRMIAVLALTRWRSSLLYTSDCYIDYYVPQETRDVFVESSCWLSSWDGKWLGIGEEQDPASWHFKLVIRQNSRTWHHCCITAPCWYFTWSERDSWVVFMQQNKENTMQMIPSARSKVVSASPCNRTLWMLGFWNQAIIILTWYALNLSAALLQIQVHHPALWQAQHYSYVCCW